MKKVPWGITTKKVLRNFDVIPGSNGHGLVDPPLELLELNPVVNPTKFGSATVSFFFCSCVKKGGRAQTLKWEKNVVL